MEDNILKSVKNSLGINEEINAFDQELLVLINTIFSVLYQIGVMSSTDYILENKEETWSDKFGYDSNLLSMIKTYVINRVRIIFDPPSNSFVLDALKAQVQELEWRIYIEAEGGVEENESDTISSPSRSQRHEVGREESREESC